MAIGNWGKDIVFSVSDRRVFTLQNMVRTVGSQWATHSRIGKKDKPEFLRPTLQKITFTMDLDASLGVRPRATLEKLERLTERGTVNALVLGGRRIGRYRWRITGTSETWETVYNRGELVRAKVNVTMEEYL